MKKALPIKEKSAGEGVAAVAALPHFAARGAIIPGRDAVHPLALSNRCRSGEDIFTGTTVAKARSESNSTVSS